MIEASSKWRNIWVDISFELSHSNVTDLKTIINYIRETMTTFGLNIKIPKESLIKLKEI